MLSFRVSLWSLSGQPTLIVVSQWLITNGAWTSQCTSSRSDSSSQKLSLRAEQMQDVSMDAIVTRQHIAIHLPDLAGVW